MTSQGWSSSSTVILFGRFSSSGGLALAEGSARRTVSSQSIDISSLLRFCEVVRKFGLNLCSVGRRRKIGVSMGVNRGIKRLKYFHACRKTGNQQLVAISDLLSIGQFLNPLVVFLKRHAYSPASSNADTAGAEIEGHRSPTNKIGAGLVLGTYALLIRKATLK
jgi:hypothetical protein